jgi:phage shock protein A
MIKQILTLLRGKAFEAEQEFTDRHALPLLSQQIREAAAGIQAARKAVAVAIAQNEQEVLQHRLVVSRITDLETRAISAMGQGKDMLAREAAEAIACLEAERDASEKAQAAYASGIGKLKAVVRNSEMRLRELQRGERLASAHSNAQRLNAAIPGDGLSTLRDAEETLLRLRVRQQEIDTAAAALKEMEEGCKPSAVIEKLADAGCGAPLKTTGDEILARLRARMNNAA